MMFYLGTHQPHWIGQTTIPLFVSRRTLAPRKKLPKAIGLWALDSGGFSELSMYGEWRTDPGQYVEEVERFSTIGNLTFAAPQDWMCEPWIVQKTGLSVAEHQARTVENFLHLRDVAPHLPFMPVLQGYTLAEYLACANRYVDNGIDLEAEPRIGVGSICRRQKDSEVHGLIHALAECGFSLHAFGYKTTGLPHVASSLASSDSMAWSFTARRRPPLDGCDTHINCANCFRYALIWYHQILDKLKMAA